MCLLSYQYVINMWPGEVHQTTQDVGWGYSQMAHSQTIHRHLMNTAFLKRQDSGWWSVGCNIAGALAARQHGNMDMRKVAETFNADTTDQSWIQRRHKDKQRVKKEPCF